MSKAFFLITYILSAPMATIEEDRSCQVDEDCSKDKYCYDVSGQCVQYTLCDRYNRAEGAGRSRHPSHCGKCLFGYKAEILGTGEEALLCKKINAQHSAVEPVTLSNDVIIWIIIAAILALLAVVAGFVFRRHICCLRRKKKTNQCTEVHVACPTAPPAENSPFIRYENSTESFNNNHYLKDKNSLVNAAPFKEPAWIRTNPEYNDNLSDENLNVTGQLHNVAQLTPTMTNSNSWVAVPLSLQEYGTEEIDNSVNAALVQRNGPSTSGEAGNSNGNNFNTANGSTPDNDTHDGHRERNTRQSNILITQKISMNVNVLNSD